MYWIAGLVCGLFLLLLGLARKEDAPGEVSVLLRPFYKVAMFLYKKWSLWFPGALVTESVERDLVRLNPGEPVAPLKTEYYVKKVAMSLAVIVLGTVFAVLAKISAAQAVILEPDGAIQRGGYSEDSREISIIARYGDEKMDFRLQIEPRKLSKEEVEGVFDTLFGKLPELILGENEGLQQVITDLNLLEGYDGFPVEVEWDSEQPDIVSDTGRVYQVTAAQNVKLTVRMSYSEYSRDGEIMVTVIPPKLTESQQLYKDMEEMLMQSQSEKPEEEKWQLPKTWRGELVYWEQAVEDNGGIVWGMALVAAVVMYLGADKDLHEQVENRKQSLRKDYPEIVHKLVLFVGAGMTIRGAFCKIAGDYEGKVRNERILPAYEEMLYTCRELQAGVSEGAAYEHFGKRTGLTEYVRLCALLMQNLKRGNRALLERLREEADKASEERLQQSKKLGEEAGTKLLVPMVLLLAVVMVIVMIPAFSGI